MLYAVNPTHQQHGLQVEYVVFGDDAEHTFHPATASDSVVRVKDTGGESKKDLDGFRSVALIEFGKCTLYSRNGHEFSSFSDLALKVGNAVMPRSLVLDGEIVCLDERGCPQFTDLLFRKGNPCFVALDILRLNGKTSDLND